MDRGRITAGGCPIGAAAERVGDVWSLLIMRESLDGYTRFDEFKSNLGIAPNILTHRLRRLVDGGLLTRIQYSDRPPRYEYLPTEAGVDFLEVLIALYAWGVRHTECDQRQIRIVDQDSRAAIEPQMIDRKTGRALSTLKPEFVAGVDASKALQARLSPKARGGRRARGPASCVNSD